MFNINLHNNEYISNWIRKYKYWEKPTSEVLIELLKKNTNTCLIDIGANIGYFSLLSASLGHSVIAFEPIIDNIQLFRKSVNDNNFEKFIKIFEVAIGDDNSELVFNVSKNNMGICSTRDLLSSDYSYSEVVQVKTLDSYKLYKKEVPLVIKIDVEHMEKSVLLGMSETLKSPFLNYIIIEISFYDEEIFQILINNGFTIVVNIGYDSLDNNLELNFNTNYLEDKKYYMSLLEFQRNMKNNKSSDNQQRIILAMKSTN